MTGVAARTRSEQLTLADTAVFGTTGAQGGGLVQLRKQLGTSN